MMDDLSVELLSLAEEEAVGAVLKKTAAGAAVEAI